VLTSVLASCPLLSFFCQDGQERESVCERQGEKEKNTRLEPLLSPPRLSSHPSPADPVFDLPHERETGSRSRPRPPTPGLPDYLAGSKEIRHPFFFLGGDAARIRALLCLLVLLGCSGWVRPSPSLHSFFPHALWANPSTSSTHPLLPLICTAEARQLFFFFALLVFLFDLTSSLPVPPSLSLWSEHVKSSIQSEVVVAASRTKAWRKLVL
jgi:hypothetical protein